MTVDLVALEREIHFFNVMPLGTGAELRLGARRPATKENRLACVHLSALHEAAIIPAMDVPAKRYRAGESLEDFCRACKTDRLHTVVVADAEGRPIRVSCGFCHSEHNYRGGARIGVEAGGPAGRPAGSPTQGPRSSANPFPIVSDRERTNPP